MTTKRIDNPDGPRFYEVQVDEYLSIKLPSVTSVLQIISKPALYNWYASQTSGYFLNELAGWQSAKPPFNVDAPWKIVESIADDAKKAARSNMTKAGDIGSRVHEYIECLNTGTPLPDVDEDMEAPIRAYHEWVDEVGLEIIESERVVYSLDYEFAGTLDAIGRLRNGALAVIDYKTSSGIYDEMALQCAAYVTAYNEMFKADVQEAYIAQFPKDPSKKFQTKRVGHIPSVFEGGFVPALRLWHTMKQNQQKLWRT